MKRAAYLLTLAFGLWVLGSPLQAAVWFLDLSKAANMGPEESFDEAAPGIQDLQKKSGLEYLPSGPQTFRGVPFQLLNPASNNGQSYVVLKGRRKPNFPEAVSLPGGHQKAAYLYFLHTCRWGGTASNITVAEYDVVYDDGKVEIIPLHVGVELANFWGSDDTSSSYLGWWYKYKNAEMGINLYGWKNPRPDEPIQSILFKSPGKMPVPILFAVTGSDKEISISNQSPKPEKTFRTDTKNWIPFESSSASPAGTAIDMSFLLDAPAGKHGAVKAEGDKLVFEDGTEARFWGAYLGRDILSLSKDSMAKAAIELASSGCNLVVFDIPKDPKVAEDLMVLADVLKSKGIYLELRSTEGAEMPVDLAKDQGVIPQSFGSSLEMYLNSTDRGYAVPLKFQDEPMVMNPGMGLLPSLFYSEGHPPYQVGFGDGWPDEYLGESTLLNAVYGCFQGWPVCLQKGMDPEDTTQGLTPTHLLPVALQYPIGALIYLRGDLKEGKTYILEPRVNGPDKLTALKALAHRSGISPDGKVKTDRSGELKAKINEKTDSFISDTGQINWQGNVGIVKVDSPRFQALIGFLANRKFNNNSWAVETTNPFAALSLISLNKKAIPASDHLLLTGVTRMENTGMVYNQAKTKLLDPGKAPILVEPLKAKIVLYRYQMDPKLKVRALDAAGQAMKAKVPVKWVKNSMVVSWVPGAFYLEVTK